MGKGVIIMTMNRATGIFEAGCLDKTAKKVGLSIMDFPKKVTFKEWIDKSFYKAGADCFIKGNDFINKEWFNPTSKMTDIRIKEQEFVIYSGFDHDGKTIVLRTTECPHIEHFTEEIDSRYIHPDIIVEMFYAGD